MQALGCTLGVFDYCNIVPFTAFMAFMTDYEF